MTLVPRSIPFVKTGGFIKLPAPFCTRVRFSRGFFNNNEYSTRCSDVSLADVPISAARTEDVSVPGQRSHSRYMPHQLCHLELKITLVYQIANI